jgi:hypothetical protein
MESQQGLVRRKQRAPQKRYNYEPYTRKATGNELERLRERRIIYCGQNSCEFTTTVSTNFIKHLLSIHKVQIDGEASSFSLKVNKAMELLAQDTSVPVSDSQTDQLLTDSVRTAITHLIVQHSLPFNCIEWPMLASLIRVLNPRVQECLPTSRRTMKTLRSSGR